MTSWREPDFYLEIDDKEQIGQVLSGSALAVKIHRASKKYPLSGMVLTSMSCLWLNSAKAKIILGEPIEIEILGSCDPMVKFKGIAPIFDKIGLKIKGKITRSVKDDNDNRAKERHFLKRPIA